MRQASNSHSKAGSMTTILVIEDDQILLETLRYNLERASFTVETATDGLAGLELAREIHPDLVILDLMLPGLDGFSVCRALTNESALPIVETDRKGKELRARLIFQGEGTRECGE